MRSVCNCTGRFSAARVGSCRSQPYVWPNLVAVLVLIFLVGATLIIMRAWRLTVDFTQITSRLRHPAFNSPVPFLQGITTFTTTKIIWPSVIMVNLADLLQKSIYASVSCLTCKAFGGSKLTSVALSYRKSIPSSSSNGSTVHSRLRNRSFHRPKNSATGLVSQECQKSSGLVSAVVSEALKGPPG